MCVCVYAHAGPLRHEVPQMPFELVVLEAALKEVVSASAMQVKELEGVALPALDALTKSVSGLLAAFAPPRNAGSCPPCDAQQHCRACPCPCAEPCPPQPGCFLLCDALSCQSGAGWQALHASDCMLY
jgi:hypothetical protein